MKRKASTLLGVPYEIPGEPETLSELLAICGGSEKIAIAHAVQKLVDNHHNPKIRPAFIKRVEQTTGILRTSADKTDGEYFKRVLRERGEKPSVYTPLLQDLAERYPLNGATRQKTAGQPKLAKLAKKYFQGAEEIQKAGKLATAASTLAAELGIPVEPAIEAVALALKEREDRRRSEVFVKSLTQA